MNKILYPDQAGQLIDLVFGSLYDPVTQQQIYADSGTIVIKDSAGSIVISSSAVTINPTTGEIKYVFTPTESTTILLDNPNYDYRVEWKFAEGLTNYERITYFDALPWMVKSQLTDQDIIATLPILNQSRDTTTGSATGGTTTTIIDTHLNDPSEMYIGSSVEVKTAANSGFHRQVETYDSDTNTFTLDRPLPFPVLEKDQYNVSLGFEPVRNRAFKQIISKLTETFGFKSISHLIDFNDVTQAHLYLSVAMLAQQRSNDSGDMWDGHSQKNYGSYAEEMNRVKIKFQEAGSGTEDNSDISRETRIIRMTR